MKTTQQWKWVGALAIATLGVYASAEPFGDEADQRFGDELWDSLLDQQLTGDNRIMSRPYEGMAPHGGILDTMESELTIDGETGVVIVKHNYAGDDVSIDAVADDPEAYLDSVTVMFQRDGYDPDNNDWFWAKYLPDGSFDQNPDGVPLTGRVAKGMPSGCIACHTAAPGDDLVYINDRY